MNIRKKYMLLSILIYFLVACSSSAELSKNLKIEMLDSHIDAWLNMMPGTSPGTFHFIGEIALQNNSNTLIDSLEISNVTVYCDSEAVYSFKPEFKTKSDDDNIFLEPGTNRIFKIRTGKGLKVNETIIKHKRIDLKLDLKTNLGEQFFDIKDIKVQRAY